MSNALSSPLEPCWLYIDFNSYFASVEQQLQPRLRGRPVAVVPVDTDSTCAIAASYEAKAYGIKTGTPIWEAKQKCPGLICVVGNHEQYRDFHERIVQEVGNHLPVAEVCSIDEVACRLMKNETSTERLSAIVASIKRGIAANIGEYVKCSIGVAPNKYLAKIATDMHKPDGFTVLAGDDIASRLRTLKLRDLPGVGYNNEKRLYLAGIYTMDDLLALPPKRLRSVWGSIWGERIALMLRGFDLPQEETTRSTVGHSHVMAPQLRDPEKARFVARRLTMKCASRMRRLGYYASTFYFSARLENGRRIEHGGQCYRAQDSMTFLKLLEEAWEALSPFMKGQRIKKVSVSLHDLSQPNLAQSELFTALRPDENASRHKAEKMSAAMDKINHRFGRDSVSIGMLPHEGRSFSGTKIAFTRIPDKEEFLE